MKDLKILITAAGSPGSATNIRYLKSIEERKLILIGTDLNHDKIGKHWCDKFYTVPKGEDDNFIPRLLEIIKKEKPDVLLPQSSSEVIPLSKNKDVLEDAGVKVLISSEESVYKSENKAELYKFLEGGPVKIPKFRLVNTLADFLDAVKVLGYPNTPVCFKPPISKGTRGFRILRDDVS
ncbi:MAG: ATP-dependent carboxylate-amine ligase, partial [Candidatus Poseidoniia archaeon]